MVHDRRSFRRLDRINLKGLDTTISSENLSKEPYGRDWYLHTSDFPRHYFHIFVNSATSKRPTARIYRCRRIKSNFILHLCLYERFTSELHGLVSYCCQHIVVTTLTVAIFVETKIIKLWWTPGFDVVLTRQER